ncbi:isochorismatase [Gordonia phthalatica]|uniref:Isochorismatase n=2 Tax=Gordonia phthalatica TaxID=1136941 RepID=A0A0N9N8V7_9ACTN|nr:isochorismatase [Gordonia phthalatica]
MVDYLVPDWANAALLVIDVQNDFVDGPAAIVGTPEVIPNIAATIAEFRRLGRPVIHVVRSYRPGDSDVDLLRRAAIEAGQGAVAPGTLGAEIPRELLPGDVDYDWDSLRFGAAQQIGDVEYILYKPRWSAFFRTPLDSLLGDHDVTTVVVAGCNLPNCPRATITDASELDYRTVLVTDATSQATDERLADLGLIGVQLRTSSQVVQAMAAEELLGEAESLWVAGLESLGDDIDVPSGCGDWTIRQLVDHVAGGGERYRILLDGGSAADTAATRGLDYIGDDPIGTFWEHEHQLRESAERADLSVLVDHRAGKRSGAELMVLRLLELTVHSKDLADALGTPWRPGDELTDFLLREAADVVDQMRALGHIGAVMPTESGDAADRLLAFVGRA